MRTLNFNHLHYFWVVARLGSVTRASRELHLTQPTLSTQIKQLERELGAALFTRTGREMILTPAGRTVMQHADAMFRGCEEMVEALAGRGNGHSATLTIGMSKSVSKLVVRSIIEPLRRMDPPVRIVCTERRTELLLDELRLQRLDLLIADTPVSLPSEYAVAGCMVGESAINLYAAPALAERHARGFPRSLSGAPFALPLRGTALRTQLQGWFDANQVRPTIAAEVEDRAMLNYLAQAGYGIVPVAALIGDQISRQFGLRFLGTAQGVKDRYFAAALESNLRKPVVAAVFAAARERFVAASPKEPGAGVRGSAGRPVRRAARARKRT